MVSIALLPIAHGRITDLFDGGRVDDHLRFNALMTNWIGGRSGAVQTVSSLAADVRWSWGVAPRPRERSPRGGYYPNRWLVLAITVVIAARIGLRLLDGQLVGVSLED
jgi:hypothetical protein